MRILLKKTFSEKRKISIQSIKNIVFLLWKHDFKKIIIKYFLAQSAMKSFKTVKMEYFVRTNRTSLATIEM